MKSRCRVVVISAAHRTYRGLLMIHPRAFRERYTEEMLRLFVDRCYELSEQRSWWPLLLWWQIALSDLVANALITHFDAFRRGDRDMARILSMVIQAGFAITGTSLFLYVVFKGPLSYDAIVTLCWGIACLSIALAWSWAAAFRSRRLVRDRS